ncbi:hypothetical protein DSCW_17970 [Desulfosarcina widdelii]|uniref:Uncharacterized protein n=1 Tax=Desulfosarcina widdelii TaxID=947919 RepID=A0A5K7Z143_9BACT|nr:hypothetical protein [Desulfosarcina widdelii]BBO74380.1 hypothetical protein DSCW_17970 [Desulfosarcina widdelii]
MKKLIALAILLFAAVVCANTYYYDGADWDTEVDCYYYDGDSWETCDSYYYDSGWQAVASGQTFVHLNGVETQADDDDWTDEVGSPDYDYSTTGLSMEGDECIELGAGEHISIAVTPRSETYCAFLWRITESYSSTGVTVRLYDGSSNQLGILGIQNDEDWEVTATGGTKQINYNEISSPPATIYWKLRVKQGTGGNAEFQVWWSTDGSSWSGGTQSIDGTETGQLARVRIFNAGSGTMHIDWWIENDTDISDASF